MMLRPYGTLIALALFLLACGDGVGANGSLVGGSCTGAQCAPGSICKTGGDFPDGMCTVACSVTSGCPSGSVCVDKSGGICMISCTVSRDCRPGYTCKGKKRIDKQGDALVCAE